jgi:3-oxoacyl-[acyl-carrier-protein] synthase II
LEARSGIAAIKSFAIGEFRPSYAAEVKDFAPERAGLPRKKLKMMGRHAQMALAAVIEASADAALDDAAARPAAERIGVMFGVGMLNADSQELGRTFARMKGAMQEANASAENVAQLDAEADAVGFTRAALIEMSPLWLLRHIPNMVSAHATIALDARASSNTIMTGCAAAAHALGEAARVISRGEADVMFAGGADARISPLAMLRYRDLGWLATREAKNPETISAPFDHDAAGFVSGEGAGVLVLEAYEHARARGARIYAEVAGYGAANDAYDPLRPHTEGRGLARAIARCLASTDVTLDEKSAVFAPATALPAFDQAIATALATTFGARRLNPPVTATRSLIGHTHAASSALDVIAAARTLNESVIPPTINLHHPIIDFNFVKDAPRHQAVETALVTAYGFGGHAAALSLRRCEA